MNDADQESRIQHEERNGKGAFFIEMEGSRVGELAYSRLGEKRVNIVHTEVGPRLQGRGVARRLLDAAVAWARETNTRIAATCPYAKAQFAKDASIRDVYDP
jgi:predicted GNAT family acetyltransferase